MTEHTLPPLGMVPYLPPHNHIAWTACKSGCPVYDWKEHTERHGNPYEALSKLRADTK